MLYTYWFILFKRQFSYGFKSLVCSVAPPCGPPQLRWLLSDFIFPSSMSVKSVIYIHKQNPKKSVLAGQRIFFAAVWKWLFYSGIEMSGWVAAEALVSFIMVSNPINGFIRINRL